MAMRRTPGSWVRRIGVCALLVGLLLAGGLGAGWWWTDRQARSTAHELADTAGAAFAHAGPDTAGAVRAPSGVGGPVIAVVRVPRLGPDWRMPVQRGTDADVLRQGLGRYAGSPAAGRVGNLGLAGHRTTWGAPFRHLDRLRHGDLIQMWTARGRFDYAVLDTGVTDPSDVSVIGAGVARGRAMLTLTTCHPEFSAAQRLYVHAVLVSESDVSGSDVTESDVTESDADRPPDQTPGSAGRPAVAGRSDPAGGEAGR